MFERLPIGEFSLQLLIALLSASAFYSFAKGCFLPLGAFVIIISFMVFAFFIIFAIISFVEALGSLFSRDWLRAKNRIAKAAVVIFLIPPSLITGDYIHLGLCYPYYLATLRNADRSGVRATFPWGHAALFAGHKFQSEVLVYDPTNKTGLNVGITYRDSEEPSLVVNTRRLLGDFYVETVSAEPEKHLEWQHIIN